MSYKDHLNKSCDIEEHTATQDDYGQEIKEWNKKATNVPLRYRRASSSEVSVENSNYQVTLEDFVFWFEYDVDINKGDRILVDGEYYIVKEDAFTDSSHHHKKVIGEQKSF